MHDTVLLKNTAIYKNNFMRCWTSVIHCFPMRRPSSRLLSCTGSQAKPKNRLDQSAGIPSGACTRDRGGRVGTRWGSWKPHLGMDGGELSVNAQSNHGVQHGLRKHGLRKHSRTPLMRALEPHMGVRRMNNDLTIVNPYQ